MPNRHKKETSDSLREPQLNSSFLRTSLGLRGRQWSNRWNDVVLAATAVIGTTAACVRQVRRNHLLAGAEPYEAGCTVLPPYNTETRQREIRCSDLRTMPGCTTCTVACREHVEHPNHPVGAGHITKHPKLADIHLRRCCLERRLQPCLFLDVHGDLVQDWKRMSFAVPFVYLIPNSLHPDIDFLAECIHGLLLMHGRVNVYCHLSR